MARSFGANSTVVLAIIFFGCLFAFSLSKEVATKLGTVIGIDLGTTYSCVGVYKNGHVEIIVNEQGNRITPSWVGFTDSKSLIGEAAKNQAAVNPERTIFDVKFEDKEVQKDRNLVPYQIVNKDGKPYIQVKIKDGETRFFSPEEISAMILTKMKETAEAYLGKKIKDAVPGADHQVSGQWVTFNRSVLRHITLPVPATGQGVEINASHDTGKSLVAPSDGFLKVIWIMLQGVTMSMVSLVMLNAVPNRVCHRNKQCDSSRSRSTRNTRKKKR